MRNIDIIKRAYRSLRSARLRTFLTSMAIAVGGFTLTLTLGAGTGANKYAETIVKSNFDPAELIVGKDTQLFGNNNSTKPQEYDDTVAAVSGGGGNASFQVKRLTPTDVDEIRSFEGVDQVRENYQVTIQYVTRSEGDKRYTGTVEAYNPAQKPELKSGQLPESGDIAKGEALLPDDYIESLGFSGVDDAIGRTVLVRVQRPFSLQTAQSLIAQLQAGQLAAGVDGAAIPAIDTSGQFEGKNVTLKIVGVTKKSATALSFGTQPILFGSEDAKALSEYTTEGTPNYQRFVIVYARVKDGATKSNRDKVKVALEAKGYVVQSVEDTQKVLTQIVTILQTIVLVFGAITLIASVFGVVNTQYISVLERTREIGLMKALGMRKRDINRLFTLEATWIGFLGGTIGSVAGLIVGTVLNPVITEKLDLGAGNYLIIFKWYQVIGLIAVLMLVATVAGVLPARKAAKLDPIEALRTE